MNVIPARVPARSLQAPAVEPPAEESRRSLFLHAQELEQKLEDRERKLLAFQSELTTQRESAACALAQLRFEKEFVSQANDRLQIENRELQAANGAFMLSNSVVAAIAVAEVERARDACKQAVREIVDASALLGQVAEAKIKGIYEVSEAAIKRVFDSANKAIEEAKEHALRAGITLEGEQAQPQPHGTPRT